MTISLLWKTAAPVERKPASFTDENIYNSAMAMVSMHRHAEPGEIAGTVFYLLSYASSYTAGECIVDGGLTI